VLLAGIPGEFVKTKFALNDIAYDVLLDTGIRIQPLPVWQSEWDNPDQYSNTQLLRNIAKDGIWLDSLVAGNVTQIK
jgi:antitoxin ChpS